jgi:hypothetical protein
MGAEEYAQAMHRIVALLATAALAVVPLAAAGCGADDVNPESLAQAADATRDQGGVHMTIESTINAAGQTIPVKMEGDADLENASAHIKTEGGNGIPRMENILVGTVMYLKMEGMEEQLGAEWAKVDLAKAGEAAGIDLEQLMAGGQGSPADQLKYLKAMGNLEEVGSEDVDGVGTTHYKGEVDLRKYPDTVPADEREQARKTVDKLLELSGDATMPMEVWIDEDDLVRRQKMTMKQKKPQEFTSVTDVRFSDFGKQVSIEEPDDAKDLTDIATQGIRDSAGG